MRKSLLIVAPMVVLLIAAILLPLANSANNLVLANKKAVNRTRKTVRMLDDIYKTAVVLITTHYVKDEDSLAAGSAAKALFAAIKKKGWHEVKILD
ncbi:MAG: hypothetical protein VB859_07325, partial [Planctomycetaceae bacterium]